MQLSLVRALRVILTLVLCLGFTSAQAVSGACVASAQQKVCHCCTAPDSACCELGREAAPQPVVSVKEGQHQDVLAPVAVVTSMLPAATPICFPTPARVLTGAGGSVSFQSLFCQRTI